MENKGTHIGRMEKRLQKWSEKLDKFVAKGKGVGAGAKLDYRERIGDVESRYNLVRTKLDELKSRGGEDWRILSEDVENAWKELKVAYKKMIS